MTRDIMMMGLGAGMLMMYQKYNKPVMKEMERVVDKTARMANDKLEDMMQKVLLSLTSDFMVTCFFSYFSI